ncbi:efflux RND transporter periplasmic adaptor subunit [Denitromonas sp.]|uniref:efflux RND transporter periplasmic adaptor subunit n=1 Tax=Denitromonas sp. TaxID=2734609 RepID=UPI003A8ABDC6
MNRQTSLFPLIVLCAAALAAPPAFAADLETALVERAPVDVLHVAEGVVEAVSSATIAAQVQGRIVDVQADAGDRVRAGQVLMRIDASEADQAVAGAAASVAQAQAAYINAQAEWRRTVALRERNFVSQAAVDQAEAAMKAAQAGLKAAQASRGQAVTVRDFTTIVAPLAGVVAARHAEAGEMAQPGRPLLTVYDPAQLRVVAQLPQSVAQGLSNAPLAADIILTGGERRVAATAVMLVPSADPRTHTMEVRALLPATVRGVVPGQFARLMLQVGATPRLTVPGAAVIRRGEVTAVYVQTDAGFRLRQIRPGAVLPDGRIEILAGLNVGDRVALDPVRASLLRHQNASQQ